MKILPNSPDDWYDVAFRVNSYCVILAAAFIVGIEISALRYFDYFWRNGMYWLLLAWVPIGRMVALCAAAVLLLWSYLLLREPRYFRNVPYAAVGICLSAITFGICWFCETPASIR